MHTPSALFCSQADAGDAWRLERVAQLLRDGGVGIVPTDSLPAVVCDLTNRDAVMKLFACMQLSPKKRLSVLCRRGARGGVGVGAWGWAPGEDPWPCRCVRRVELQTREHTHLLV
jgi:hypothetical protein